MKNHPSSPKQDPNLNLPVPGSLAQHETSATEEGEPWVPPVVQRVEKMMATDPSLDHEYHWFSGLEPLTTAVTRLLLGTESRHVRENKVVTFQSVGGTGALRIGAQFLSKEMGYDTFCLSSPSWEDHEIVFRMAGFTTVLNYRYWSDVTKSLDITGLLEDLSKAPENAVVVLQPSAHNPTGCDPSREQWARIADVIQEKKLFPFFDVPYQGLASRDVDDDIWPVRFFADRGLEFMVAYSLALSTALYSKYISDHSIVHAVVYTISLYLLLVGSPILFFFPGHFLPWPVDIPGVLDSSSPASRLFPSEQGSSSKEQLPTSHLYPLYLPSPLAGIPGVPGSSAIFITGIPGTPFRG
uniref:aspartate transaminase n=1 Tax=Timema genevievae TaxID=629358 RepID=A0A7R9JS47_TIMGE|nr:unnamed protein product [Timema genevievae]